MAISFLKQTKFVKNQRVDIENSAEFIIYAFAIVFFIGGFDDFFIDVTHTLFRLTPKKLNRKEWREIKSKEERAIAIIVPAWREYDVLEAMVTTNLKRIKYKNFKWFIGVYPNDNKTLNIALDLQDQYPDKITVVINHLKGPTTKAQMVNRILDVMKESESYKDAWIADLIGIHDAEDVIHPLALKALNAQSEDLDFIQLPIFSLPVAYKSWVAGTYLDEFADLHLKEIPVRQKLRMPIPSAGVGTFFSSRILDVLGSRFSYYLDENNLTEDYEISMRIARLGGKQKFLFLLDELGDVVSTREYFPNSFSTSVRQKTRWTTGIGLQTVMRWGSFASLRQDFSFKNLMGKYACWRDQKALWANPLIYLAWGLMLVFITLNILGYFKLTDLHFSEDLKILMSVNLFLFLFRVFQRARFSSKLYGSVHGFLSIPRLFVGGVINANAAIRAAFQFRGTKKESGEKKIAWDKTQHSFPTEDFFNSKVKGGTVELVD